MGVSTSTGDAQASRISRWETVHTCEIHPSADRARQAFEKLLAEGSETLVGCSHLLIGRNVRDVRNEPVGTFAGEIGPTTLLSTFAGGSVERRKSPGRFSGQADATKGSFGSSDEDVVVMDCHGREQTRIADHARLRRVLEPIALDDAAVDGLLGELHQGHALVVYAKRQTS
jgi:hypothetical protein